MQRFKSGVQQFQQGTEEDKKWGEEESYRTKVDFYEENDHNNADNYNPNNPNINNPPFLSPPSLSYESSGPSSLPSPMLNPANVSLSSAASSIPPSAAPPAKDNLLSRLLRVLGYRPSSIHHHSSGLRGVTGWLGANHKRSSQVKLSLQVLFLAWLFVTLSRKFQFTDNDDARFQHLRNTECFENGINIYPPKSKEFETDPDLCVLPNQYKKFIWIFVDSLAFDQAEELRAMFPERRNVHKIMNHGFKFSTAIYTTFFTGKIPTNYAGHEIFSDNLFYQMRRAGMKLKFVGPTFPTLHLLGSGSEEYFAQRLSVLSESTPFEFLRSNGDEFLKTLAKEGASAMFTTNVIDDRIHRTGKQDPRTRDLIAEIRKTLKQIKQFVDSHPDYLFILNADHGGSLTGGVNEGQLHGEPSNGNEAWVMFYNPTLTTLSKQETWLDTVDVCGTVAKYFYGVNIPLESIGKAAANTDSTIHKYKVLKSNTLQLKQLVDLKDFPYDKTAFQQSITETNPSLAIDKMEQFILSVKLPLINFKRFPTSELFLIGVAIFICQISLLISECGDYPIFQYLKTYPLAVFISGLYLYLDFLFLKFDYFKSFKGIFPYYSIFFGVCFFHHLALCLGSLLNNNNNNANNNNNYNPNNVPSSGVDGSTSSGTFLPTYESPSLSNSGPVSSTQRLLYTCSLRVSIVLCLLFGVKFYWSHVSILDETPFPYLIGYVTLAAGLLFDLRNQYKINSVAGLFEAIRKGPLRKEALYFAIIALIYLYELTEVIFFMQLAYFGIFAHAAFALIYQPQLLIYPATTLLFAVSNTKERLYLVMVLSPMYYILTQTLKDLPSWNASSLPFRMMFKSAFLLLINIAFDCYVTMGGQFNMDVVVEAGGVGVVNVEQYPGFSGFLMGYHKLGYFFVLIAYLARIIASDKRDELDIFSGISNASLSFSSSIETGIYFWKYLFVKALVLMWVFHLSFWLYKDYLTCFLMTVIVTIVTLSFGVVLVIQTVPFGELALKLVRYIKVYVQSRREPHL